MSLIRINQINLPPRFKLPEVPLPPVLPTDGAALTALLHEQRQAYSVVVGEAQKHIAYLFEQFFLHRQRMFGARSEQSSAQGRLFDEAELLALDTAEEQDAAQVPAPAAPPKTRTRGKRSPLSPDLPRIDIVHDVPEAERIAPCGTPLVEIGEDISEQLHIEPMKICVLRHIRKRYGFPGGMQAPVVAPLPPQPLPKTNASPEFLAMLLTTKYADGLPLARFEHVLARHGAPVPRQTLARWVIGSAALLQPLLNLTRDALHEGSLLHMDETVVQVLKEKGREAESKSYMWVQTGGPPGKPVVIFDYDPSRSGEVSMRLLDGFRGYLMADGYGGYNRPARTEGIERLACWAHVRRRFVDAARVQPKGVRGLADHAVDLIGKLYAIERRSKEAADEERLLARHQQSLPLLAALKDWLDKTLPTVLPKSALGSALSTMRDQWPMLCRYTERGDLPIDNNRCENAIRPFVIGRKAWLFSDTPAGANASAVVYSLIETAKANGLEPYSWLCRVMRDLPAAKTVDEVDALMPWNLKPQDLIRATPR